MTKPTTYTVTREKHLDHMVRVVPLIVFFYGIQYYMVSSLKVPLSNGHFTFLGLFLVAMIATFVVYDLHHKVTCFEDRLEISFLGHKTLIPYSEIVSIEIPEEEKTFCTVKIKMRKSLKTFYFVDSGKDLKAFIEGSRTQEKLAA